VRPNADLTQAQPCTGRVAQFSMMYHDVPHPQFYTLFETLTRPHRPSMLTSPEGAYWKAVRKAVAASFTTTNLK
jgi:hypothetical protein